MSDLTAGDKVRVFQDPITRTDYEGTARLVKCAREDRGDGLSLWQVEFDDEPGDTYLRTINKEDRIT